MVQVQSLAQEPAHAEDRAKKKAGAGGGWYKKVGLSLLPHSAGWAWWLDVSEVQSPFLLLLQHLSPLTTQFRMVRSHIHLPSNKGRGGKGVPSSFKARLPLPHLLARARMASASCRKSPNV